MKKFVVIGMLMLVASLVIDYLLAYNFVSMITEKLNPAKLSYIQFLYILSCFLAYWFTLTSIYYIFNGRLKASLKYVGTLISGGIIFGLFLGGIWAAICHQDYLGHMMIITIMAWLVFSIFGSIVYPAHEEIVEECS